MLLVPSFQFLDELHLAQDGVLVTKFRLVSVLESSVQLSYVSRDVCISMLTYNGINIYGTLNCCTAETAVQFCLHRMLILFRRLLKADVSRVRQRINVLIYL